MKLCLLTQGEHGISALTHLFSKQWLPNNIFVNVCLSENDDCLFGFLKRHKIEYSICQEHDSPIFIGSSIDALLVSISWPYLIPESVIKAFKFAVNLHPGLLPEYKGCFSTSWSMINGASHCGYTYHLLEKKVDSGDILFQEKVPITQSDTAFSLHYNIMYRAINRLDFILTNVEFLPRNKNFGGRYYPNKIPYEGQIPTSFDANKKNLFVRAMYFPPNPGAFELVNGQPIYAEFNNDS